MLLHFFHEFFVKLKQFSHQKDLKHNHIFSFININLFFLRIKGAFKSITTETFFFSTSSCLPLGPAKPVVNHPHNSNAINESPIITIFFVSDDLTLSI
jgi:hypothetical protein